MSVRVESRPRGRQNRLTSTHYRQFDFSWTFLGLEAVGIRTGDGYAVQGRIDWKAFQSLGFPSPDSGRAIEFGIYRAEFQHTEGREWSESWISWIDPQTVEPDFHGPESFGYLKMVR